MRLPLPFSIKLPLPVARPLLVILVVTKELPLKALPFKAVALAVSNNDKGECITEACTVALAGCVITICGWAVRSIVRRALLSRISCKAEMSLAWANTEPVGVRDNKVGEWETIISYCASSNM